MFLGPAGWFDDLLSFLDFGYFPRENGTIVGARNEDVVFSDKLCDRRYVSFESGESLRQTVVEDLEADDFVQLGRDEDLVVFCVVNLAVQRAAN